MIYVLKVIPFMIGYIQLKLTLTISFNGHFHMWRNETFCELNFRDTIRFEM